MELIDINNVLLVSLWTLSVEEVSGDNYNFSPGITKVALNLCDESLSKEDILKLEHNNWIVIEVESGLRDASSEELEDYLKSYLDEIVRNIKESQIMFLSEDFPSKTSLTKN